MRALTPLPRSITRPVSVLLLIVWVAVMALLARRSYLQASAATLATDLARYGSAAVWRGVYYRGEKIGFTVSQTVPEGDGFALEEDGRLQMALLGATTAAAIRTTAHVDAGFTLRAFEFSLDPGTGAIDVRGRLDGRRLTLEVRSPSGTRTEQRDLDEPPALSLNLSRRLANGGLVTGARHRWTIFDPATLRNSPVTVDVGRRELVRGAGTAPLPAFRVEMAFAGLRTTSWVTDTGEVIREESPLGLITVRESPDSARAMAVSRRMQVDLLQASAIVPRMSARIDEPRDVRRLRMRLTGLQAAGLAPADLNGVAQTVSGDGIELVDPRQLRPAALDPSAAQYLAAEAFIESDAPEIRAEAETAVRDIVGDRARAERLTRYVNALLDKKPTISLPSAREVLRTKVGDCNEHTALYVAMARAIGIPSRIAVGLVFIHGAFYYHAWPEVYVDRSATTGLWLPVDPTLNQFPADATHLRLTRGGLEKQAAILPLIGRLSIQVDAVELAPDSTPILVGRQPIDLGSIAVPIPQRAAACCACRR
ncbi:MAG TPA: transglutaminase-like domain-containing protein [Vicinamibacterales bacterium]|nr:transglutaminase-like domain-containing protein [Vicinamibacterales bacterium]